VTWMVHRRASSILEPKVSKTGIELFPCTHPNPRLSTKSIPTRPVSRVRHGVGLLGEVGPDGLDLLLVVQNGELKAQGAAVLVRQVEVEGGGVGGRG